MAEIEYHRARVALYDPVHVNLRTTRYALHEIGFRKFATLTSLDELKRRMQDDAPELLVIETANHEAEIFKLVRSIRMGDVSNNAFMAILLTCWKRDTSVIRDAIGCGADDLIIRPFSTTFIEERIRTLIRARKPFIVTSDYIGPDRRKDPDRGPGAAPPIDAPNMLKAVVENDEEALSHAYKWIDEAKRTVDSERLRRLCMRVIVGAEAAMREISAGREPVIEASEFVKGAAELRLRLARMRSSEASRVSKALCEVAAELGEEGGMTQANLSLAKELAMAAYVAYAGDDGMERSNNEIEQAAQMLQKRMAQQSARNQAQKEGGAEDEAELKAS